MVENRGESLSLDHSHSRLKAHRPTFGTNCRADWLIAFNLARKMTRIKDFHQNQSEEQTKLVTKSYPPLGVEVPQVE